MFVFERYPIDPKSGYTRQIVWMDKAEYKERKIEYFDRKNARLKTLLLTEYHQYKDQYWRPHDMHMENHQTGKSTRLLQSNFKFDAGLSNRDFNKTSLQRVR